MLYIARVASKAIPTTPAYQSKGLPELTSCKASDVTFFAKPTISQVAFDGYRSNLEAFLHATATKKKCTTDMEAYPIPKDYTPKVLLPLPALVVRVDKKQTPDNLKKIGKNLERYGGVLTPCGKDNQVFTIDKPTMSLIEDALPRICSAQSAFLDNRCQLGAAHSVMLIYRLIDLFLATNTYEFKGINEDQDVNPNDEPASTNQEIRVDGHWFRQGYGQKLAGSSKSRKLEDGEKGRRIDDAEVEDLTPHKKGRVGISGIVRVAKPSPHTADINFGPPSSVPHKAGLSFPYFDGMLVPDLSGFRELCSSLFFRNFATPSADARKAFREFRQNCGTFVSTKAGGVITHVLMGIRAAIDSQTLLYLMFDGETYLGFCLLGEFFHVHMNGTWHAPKSADDLQVELQGYLTHSKAMQLLIEKLEGMETRDGGHLEKVKDKVTGCYSLAVQLGKLKLDSEDKESAEKELSMLVSKLRFPPFLTPSISSLKKILGLLLSDDEDLPGDHTIFIPNSGWNHFAEKDGRLLSVFGPRSFSFRNVKGKEYRIPRQSVDKDPFNEKEEKSGKQVDVIPFFLIGDKPVSACVSEWREFVKLGAFRMDFLERAAGSRNMRYERKNFEEIWNLLKEAAAAGKIGTGKEKKVVTAGPSSVDFGKGDVDSFFDALGPKDDGDADMWGM